MPKKTESQGKEKEEEKTNGIEKQTNKEKQKAIFLNGLAKQRHELQ